MSRTPYLSCALWSTVSTLALASAGCGDDELIFADARVIDATVVDAAAADASLAMATFPATLTTTATCGVAVPATADVAVMNTGSEPLIIASATATGGFTVTTTTPLTIAPGASATLTVRPPAAVIGTDVGGTTKTGMLAFVTNETGAPTRTVALSATVNGANLALVDNAGAALPAIMFTSGSGCPVSQEVFLRNTGNLAATVTSPSASGFGFGGFSPSAVVGAGETINQPVSVSTLGPCTGTATVSYQATGTICTTLPVTLNASFTISGQSSCFCS